MGTYLILQGRLEVFEDLFHHADNLCAGSTEIHNGPTLVPLWKSSRE